MSKAISDRIAVLKARKLALASKLNTLEAVAKKAERKRDTRRKIIIGAAVIAAMEKDQALADSVRRILAASVTRQQDIDVLGGLLTGKKETNAKDTGSDASKPASQENPNPSPV